MICPACQQENPAAAKFCAECGGRLRLVCPQCAVFAIGDIDRTVYPGAYPEGTAIRFERFEVWR